jgi:hypothetical protein
MAYYYATARVYVSKNDKGLSPSDLSNNLVSTDPVIVSNGSPDKVDPKQYAWYVVDVYESSTPTFAAWKLLPTSGRGTLIKYNDDVHIVVSVGSAANVNLGKVVNKDSHTEWTISNNSDTARTITPSFTITQTKSDPGGAEVPVTDIDWLNNAKKAPTIKFTRAAGYPSYPTTAVATWFKDQLAAGNWPPRTTISKGVWSKCNNRWGYFIDIPDDGIHGVIISFWSSDENATAASFRSEMGQRPTTWPTPSYPAIQAWIKKASATSKKFWDDSVCKGNNTGTPDPTPVIPDVAPPTDDTRWNPPPHVYSRSVPYGIFKKYTDPNAFNDRSARASLEASEYSALKRAIEAQGPTATPAPEYSYLQRGRIFQDLTSASVLNTANASALAGKASKPNQAKQWGFRFMYNPTSISYQTSAQNAVDWTFGSKDSAALLTGNQTVTVQIYLNRIIDLGYLNAVYGYGYLNTLGSTQISAPAAYGRSLTSDEVKGIMSRGTEYDLEFLYRCLTGDPITNNPLLNSDFKDTGSADIGYITGIPLWMYLNDNMRYFGSVASLNVNHVIFNTEMVPMLSVVDITFSRYPAYGVSDGTKYTGAIQDAAKNPTTPATGPTNP